METIVKDRLVALLENSEISFSSQHICRSGKSTLTVLIDTLEYIFDASDNGKVEDIVLCDMSMFDTIKHEVLLQKLEYSEMRGKTG